MMDRAFPRTCGYVCWLGLCGEPMARHYRAAGGQTYGACAEHIEDMERALERDGKDIRRIHACGPNCCMPGSIFDLDENVCRYEEDELGTLVAEEKELELVG